MAREPIIAPGESYRYTSGCPLETPDGFMVGTFTMIGEDGDTFLVDIPAFSPSTFPHRAAFLQLARIRTP